MTTAIATPRALSIAAFASRTSDPSVRRAALAALSAAVDVAHAELVAAGAPEAAELVVQACLILASRRGHLSADTCPLGGHLSG
jgi:hypothetical protein